ncbi:MAG: DUF1571 domain-containing protein [Planctomycetales bacterium]
MSIQAKTEPANSKRLAFRSAWFLAPLFVAVGLFVAYVESNQVSSREGAEPAAAAPVIGLSDSAGGQAIDSLDEAIAFARSRRARLSQVANYTAVFSKTELVDRRLISQTMDLKFRQAPFSVYLRVHSKRQPAREVIFVEGRNDDRMIVHDAGIKAFLTLNLKPDNPRVLTENRYPITEIGMAKMLDTALAIWEREKDIAPENVDVRLSSGQKIGSNACEELRITHQEPLSGLRFHITRVAFDIETGFPLLLEQYDWPTQPEEAPPLVERYLYSDVNTAFGVTDADFDPQNSEYNFGWASTSSL